MRIPHPKYIHIHKYMYVHVGDITSHDFLEESECGLYPLRELKVQTKF